MSRNDFLKTKMSGMWRLGSWCVAFGFMFGCGHVPHSDRPSGKVIAAVTYGGTPVTNGFVNFSNPQTGLGAGGLLDANGTTTINEVPVGDYVVTVTLPPVSQTDPNPQQQENPQLPKKFRSESTSTLKATVKAETNELKFELKE
ncbi:carboxypeptidase-like regulatory domain-containing protein [Planctomicrobium sp. SH527]|uniref:carboxypeptidase-like regulatory domain-containing protein n=1 Tax=Planctomicrobium sp. SH527 TaxID=3448123 RepID=UPI003F5AEDE1